MGLHGECYAIKGMSEMPDSILGRWLAPPYSASPIAPDSGLSLCWLIHVGVDPLSQARHCATYQA